MVREGSDLTCQGSPNRVPPVIRILPASLRQFGDKPSTWICEHYAVRGEVSAVAGKCQDRAFFGPVARLHTTYPKATHDTERNGVTLPESESTQPLP